MPLWSSAQRDLFGSTRVRQDRRCAAVASESATLANRHEPCKRHKPAGYIEELVHASGSPAAGAQPERCYLSTPIGSIAACVRFHLTPKAERWIVLQFQTTVLFRVH